MSVTITTRDCSCKQCVNCCETNPGWPTPSEALRLINDGLCQSLMLDWLEPSDEVGNEERIYVISPASSGYGGDFAPEDADCFTMMLGLWNKGRCMFLTADKKCAVHDRKPTQCRLTMGCDSEKVNVPGHPASNWDIARLWDTDEARALVTRWRNIVELAP